MSESDKKPTIAEGEELVNACPLCGENFNEPVATNKVHTCPVEGGCGKKFLVKVF